MQKKEATYIHEDRAKNEKKNESNNKKSVRNVSCLAKGLPHAIKMIRRPYTKRAEA